MSPSKAKVALLYSPCNQQKISTFFSSYSPGVFQGCNEITALFVRQHIKHIQSEHMSQLNVKRCKARETDRDRQRQRERDRGWEGKKEKHTHSRAHARTHTHTYTHTHTRARAHTHIPSYHTFCSEGERVIGVVTKILRCVWRCCMACVLPAPDS